MTSFDICILPSMTKGEIVEILLNLLIYVAIDVKSGDSDWYVIGMRLINEMLYVSIDM